MTLSIHQLVSLAGFKFSDFLDVKRCFCFVDNWSAKAKRRNTTGTGRLRHLKVVYRRFRYVWSVLDETGPELE